MKFCENCGAQLEDSAVFCEECGSKQEVSASGNDQTIVSSKVVPQKQSQQPTPAAKKTPTKSWIPILLLVVFSPVVLMLVLTTIFWWIPEFLFWVIFVGLQLFALAFMWKKCAWKPWIIVVVLIVYIAMYFI